MKTQINHIVNTAITHTSSGARAISTVLMVTLTFNALVAGNASARDFQHKALFNPSEFQLKAESNGRVMIFDQLANQTVETALDQQFDRIEHMMFVRTQHVQLDGSIQEDTDCDD